MKLRLALALVALSTVAFAQDGKPTGGLPAPQGAGPQTGTMTRGQAATDKLLNMFEGRWSTQGTFAKSDFMPNGGSDTGTAAFVAGPGRRSVIQHYKSQGALGNFEGAAVFWFDERANMFRSFWCDSMSPEPCAMSGSGNWQDGKFVLTGTQDVMGQQMQMRQTVQDITPNSFTYVEELQRNGQWQPTMTIKYTRVSGPAPMPPTGKK